MVTKKKKAERARRRNTQANKEAKMRVDQQNNENNQEEIEEVNEIEDNEESNEEQATYKKPNIKTIWEVIVAIVGVALVGISALITFVAGIIIIAIRNFDIQEYGEQFVPGWTKFMAYVVMAIAVISWIVQIISLIS